MYYMAEFQDIMSDENYIQSNKNDLKENKKLLNLSCFFGLHVKYFNGTFFIGRLLSLTISLAKSIPMEKRDVDKREADQLDIKLVNLL